MSFARNRAHRVALCVALTAAYASACSTETPGSARTRSQRGSSAASIDDAGLDASSTTSAQTDAGRTQAVIDASACGSGSCDASAPPAECLADCTRFVSIAARISAMSSDTQQQAPEQRANVRYIDLSSYANAGHGDTELALYRDAISYLVNSLSSGSTVVVPEAIDDQKLIFRIRLSDYGWSAATWEKLIATYPYAVRYDASSRLFPNDDARVEALRVATGTKVPYLQADWFFSHASRPPLYYDMLGIPQTRAALEQQLGINIDQNIAAKQVARAGFRDSGPSHFNRVIERHSLGDERGALWLTYDFAAGSGSSNVFTHPLDFAEASSEILFNLPNGMQAYMIVDGSGKRLDRAPNGAVQDPLSRDLAIESGISCVSCHAESGVLEHADEVRASTIASSGNQALIDGVAAVYLEPAELSKLFAADLARYTEARNAAAGSRVVVGVAHDLDDQHVGLMGLRDVAGVLGVEHDALRTALQASPGAFPSEIIALTGSTDARLARDAFEAVFPQLVTALGLGQVIDPN